MKSVIVKDQIEINASREEVWEVLTNPDFIKQWDELPENYSGEPLKLNSVIEWEGYSRLIVTEFVPASKLKLSMFLPRVALDASKYDVSYQYSLSGEDSSAVLAFEIGDFSTLPNAQDYYDASLTFVQTAKEKIKELAEN
ncbi:MAG TPA: SRPBCC domain-containing protein [Cyclobacteriaceae bacterium]